MRRILVALGVSALLAAACGDTGAATAATEPPTTAPSAATTAPAPTAAPTTLPATTLPATTLPATTLPPTTTTVPAADIELGEPDADGVIAVSIDGSALDPLFDAFTAGDDPFYLIHTQQDDVFIGVELYTVFGAGWTGELGTFPADCTTHGICVYLDPDGTGPLEGGGPGEGEITVTQLEDGSVVTIDDVVVTAADGQVYRITGLTLTG